ncbi:MAG: YeeE/YedE family protein, partial [Gammaproteobacteria bacterium]|nr:YeeE/YedE family protein [Gammaproteobacteria bacterium]
MKNFLAFIFGGIFSIGLMLSGMSNPEKVLNFLDLFGQWDASLAFVMMGAIAVAFVPFQKLVRQPEPKTLLNEPIELPKQTQ